MQFLSMIELFMKLTKPPSPQKSHPERSDVHIAG
jgi:hypothetical protein